MYDHRYDETLPKKVAKLALDAEAGYDALNKALASRSNSEVNFWTGFIERTEAKVAAMKSSGLVCLAAGNIRLLMDQIRGERVENLKQRRKAKLEAAARRDALASGQVA